MTLLFLAFSIGLDLLLNQFVNVVSDNLGNDRSGQTPNLDRSFLERLLFIARFDMDAMGEVSWLIS